jgi:hypothetical protein
VGSQENQFYAVRTWTLWSELFLEFREETRGTVLQPILTALYRIATFLDRNALLQNETLTQNMFKILSGIEQKGENVPLETRYLVQETMGFLSSKLSPKWDLDHLD